ncbi:MAG: FAD binding domain-containing protein [Acidimicrobiales bacterium]
MKPAPFDYHRAASIDDAVAVLAASDGEGKLLAGGQSLVPLLSMRLAQPTVLIDLNGLADLRTAEALDDGRPIARFGAMTRHAHLQRQSLHPMAAHLAGWVGHTAIRTRGTLGGSIAHADPNAECPALALASDATIHTSGPGGTRRLAVDDFFEGMLETAVADDEVLTHVDLEVPHRWGFGELARRSGDFALVLACVSELSSGWRVVIGGVDSTPVRVTDAEQALAAGVDPVEVAAIVGSRLTAYDDLHAGVDYRIAMAAELTRRAAEQALAGLNDDDRSDA